MDISMDKTLPNNLEAERMLLGAIMMDNAMPSDAKVSDLYLGQHRKILEFMKELVDRNEPVNMLSVKNILQLNDSLEAVGGAAYLATLTDGLPNIELAPQYLRMIRRESALRRIIQIGNEAMTKGYDATLDPQEIISKILEDCDEASGIIEIESGLKPIGDFVNPVYSELEARANGQHTTSFSTGFIDLDRLLSGGVRRGNLFVVAGRPGQGKTAFATNIILNMAKKRIACAFFSLEMGALEITERMLSALGKVDGNRMRTGFLNRDDWSKITRAAGELMQLPIYIDDSTAISVSDIRSRVRRIKPNGSDSGSIDVILVDYLQLMVAPEKFRKNADEQAITAAISKGLKNTAKNMNVAMVAVSQLSRASEKRTDRRPQLSDLRSSGQIEQDSDIVAFVYRQEMGSPTEKNIGKAEIIVAKQRNGPIGDIKLAFAKELTSFSDLYEGE
jgi:replicative DNA helicase